MKRYGVLLLVLLILLVGCTSKNSSDDKPEIYGTWDVVDLGDYTFKIVSVTFGTLTRDDVINKGSDLLTKFEKSQDENGAARYLTIKYRFDFDKGLDSAPDNFHKIFLTADITGVDKGVQVGTLRKGDSDDYMEISVSKFVESEVDNYYLVYESKPDYTQYIMAIALTNYFDRGTVFRPELR